MQHGYVNVLMIRHTPYYVFRPRVPVNVRRILYDYEEYDVHCVRSLYVVLTLIRNT